VDSDFYAINDPWKKWVGLYDEDYRMACILWEGRRYLKGKPLGRKILQNSIKCKKCNNEVISHYTHDFKSCPCGSVYVDGGKSYLRRCGELENMIETSVYWEFGYDV
jgi:hypothetical protein